MATGNKQELSEQIALAQKLSTLMSQMSSELEKMTAKYTTQTTAVQGLHDEFEELSEVDLSNISDQVFDKITHDIKITDKSLKGFGKSIVETGKSLTTKFLTKAAGAGGVMSGLVQGFRNIKAIGSSVIGVVSSIADSFVNVGTAILSIPLKMFQSLIGAAMSAGGGSTELAQAIEDLRKSFGSLKEPMSQAVNETARSLHGFSDTGLSTFRVFGTLAERLNLVREVAEGMGPVFGKFMDEFRDNGGAILAFQKGLGITSEQMGGIGRWAVTAGQPLSKVLLDITKQSTSLGKAFGISSKVIGKEMAKAMQDVAKFGQMSVKEIGQAVVYAKKLGVELESISGTLGAFETFDAAAEGASKLSQAFGVNVDAFKLMEAQNPADQIDMLRKSFRAAGQDASTFSRQQLKLLASSVGLDEATAKQVFSFNNAGLSLDQIKKKSEGAEKKQMTQAEAMKALSDNIERLVKSMEGLQTTSFFDAFIKGFIEGVTRSKEFQSIMFAIRRAMYEVFRIGMQLGRMFVKMFPGIKETFSALRELFDPGAIGGTFRSISKAFTTFFGELQKGTANFDKLFSSIKDGVFGFISGKGGAAGRLVAGAKKFLGTFGLIVSEGFKWVGKKITEFLENPFNKETAGFMGTVIGIFKDLGKSLADGIKFVAPRLREVIKSLVSLLTGPSTWKDAMASAGGTGKGALMEIFTPIVNSLSLLWDLIKDPLLELGRTLVSKIITLLAEVAWKIAKNMPWEAWAAIAVLGVGPAIVRGFVSWGASAVLQKVLSNQIAKQVTGAMTSKAVESAAQAGAEAAAKPMADIAKSAAPAAGGIAQAGKAAAGAAGGIAMFGKSLAAAAAPIAAVTAAVGALYLAYDQYTKLDKETAGGGFFGTISDAEIFGGPGIMAGIDKRMNAAAKKKAAAEAAEKANAAAEKKKQEDAAKASDQAGASKFLGDIDLDNAEAKLKKLESVSAALKTSGGNVQALLNSVRESFAKVEFKFLDDKKAADVQAFNKQVESLAGIFAGLESIGKSLAMTAAMKPIDSSKLATLFNSISDTIFTSKPVLTSLETDLPAEERMKLITDKFASFTGALDQIGTFNKTLTTVAGSLKQNALKPTLMAIAEMVQHTQALDDALAKGEKVNIDARLKKLATATGLGGKFTYSVQSKEVIINVNMNIVMEADTLERTVIMRPNSIIRDRLNFATNDKTVDKGIAQPEIPEAPDNTPFVKVTPLPG